MKIDSFHLPQCLARHLQGALWSSVDAPYSGAATYKVSKSEWDAYLKILPLGHREPLELYKQKLDWLRGKLTVPKVLHFVKDESHEYLMISALSGSDGTDPVWKQDVRTTVERLAQGLRLIHSVNVRSPEDSCPFNYPVQESLERIAHRIDTGQLKLYNMKPWYGNKVEDLWESAVQYASGGVVETPVFTHGDYCVPNLILCDGGISGFIDLGDAGAADPYRDFASIYRSLIRNFGETWVEVFFEAYGLPELDMKRLRFYDTLEHLLCSP